jgi:hypothetical protein
MPSITAATAPVAATAESTRQQQKQRQQHRRCDDICALGGYQLTVHDFI